MTTQRRIAVPVESDTPIEWTWSDGRLTEVGPTDIRSESLPLVAPGFVDVQINGFAGVNFGNPDLRVDDVVEVSRRLAEHGVTQFAPTLITDSVDRMASAVARLAESARDERLTNAIIGIHLEGPYLSKEDGPRGAHPLEHCLPPDIDQFERLQQSAEGLIKIVTLAPELPGAVEFIRHLVTRDVRVAIGHTAANREQILAAVDAGATLSTHLGNAAHDLIQRHHNYIFDQLGEDRLWASLIVDGHHLPPHVVQVFVRAKSPERIILVSDAVQYGGLAPGIYDAGYRKFEVRADGFIGVAGEPRLAGSGLLLTRAIENFVRFNPGRSIGEAIRCVTDRPRQWLGIDTPVNPITQGEQATFVLFRWDETARKITIEETVRDGRTIYARAQ